MWVLELLSEYVMYFGHEVSEADSLRVSWQQLCRRGSFFGTGFFSGTVNRKFIISVSSFCTTALTCKAHEQPSSPLSAAPYLPYGDTLP